MKWLISLLLGWSAHAATLAGGAPLDVLVDPDAPRTTVALVFHGGAGILPQKEQGVGAVIEKILEEGPTGETVEAYQKALFLLNAEVNYLHNSRAQYVVVTAPADTLAKAVDLALAALKAPKLTEDVFQMALSREVANATSSFESMRTVTYYYGLRHAFGSHPDSFDGSAAPQSLKGLTLETIKKWYPKLYSFARLSVSAVGPTSESAIAALLNPVLKSAGAKVKLPKPASINVRKVRPKNLTVTLINKPKATDNQILYVFPEALHFDDRERAVALVAHQILGGGLTGRLGDTLRTKRGLTYTAASRPDAYKPAWIVYTFGGVNQTKGLLDGVPEVLASFKKEKLKAEDIALAKAAMVTEFKQAIELPQDKMFVRLKLRLFNLDPSYLDKVDGYINSVTEADIERFRARFLNDKKGYVYIMGDKETVMPILESTGIKKDSVKVIELDQLI